VPRLLDRDNKGSLNGLPSFLKGVDSMILTIEEAREALRIDGPDNDVIIIPLVEAIPNYLKVTTGTSWAGVENPLVKVAAKFILQLWYFPQNEDAARLQRTIDSLIITLSAEARELMNG
jgi:hypothetical protein